MYLTISCRCIWLGRFSSQSGWIVDYMRIEFLTYLVYKWTALLHIKHVNLTGVSFYSLKYSLKRNKWYFDSNWSIVDLEWFFDAWHVYSLKRVIIVFKLCLNLLCVYLCTYIFCAILQCLQELPEARDMAKMFYWNIIQIGDFFFLQTKRLQKYTTQKVIF